MSNSTIKENSISLLISVMKENKLKQNSVKQIKMIKMIKMIKNATKKLLATYSMVKNPSSKGYSCRKANHFRNQNHQNILKNKKLISILNIKIGKTASNFQKLGLVIFLYIT
jgi:hypothetical protein